MPASIVTAYAAMGAGQALEPFACPPAALGDADIRVAVTHCGVCHTDIHAIDDDFQMTAYPFVPGHEIVGCVSEIGAVVAGLREGDRVGIGWQGRSCGQCEWCRLGEDHLCRGIGGMGTWTPNGGFSGSVVADGRFAYPLPDAMPPEVAAVLMCAGLTVYSPLRSYVTGPSPSVGVVGVGGLGHLAIQFAHALGCTVTVFSSSAAKKEEALALGADRFIAARDGASMREVDYGLDLLLCTASGETNWESLLMTLKKNARLVLIGFPTVSLWPIDLVVHQLSITGSFLGSPATMREMLSFALANGIRPLVELMPMSAANEAILRVRENRARYRVVLVNETDTDGT